MTSTSTVLLATLPALVTGALGLAGGLLTARAAIRSADRTHEVEMERLRVEERRLRAERDQALRDNRQGTYHQLLAVAEEPRALADMINTVPGVDVREEYAAWRGRFQFLVGGALVFGTDRVALAATQFADVYRRVEEETDACRDAGGKWIECLRKVLGDHSEEIGEAREKLRTAMREDVGAREGGS